MKAEEKSVVEKKSTIDGLFDGIQLSEPLTTFKDNLEAINLALGISGVTIEQRRKKANESLKTAKYVKRGATKHIREFRSSIMISDEALSKLEKSLVPAKTIEESVAERQRLIEFFEGSKEKFKKLIESFSKHKEWADQMYIDMEQRIEFEEKVFTLSLPMYFVYIDAVWDAFVLDTARAILRTNPNLSSYEIEPKANKLSRDRGKLTGCFKDCWGIDWGKSRVPLREVKEIRARRDIWVHNRGVINQQYVNMVGGNPQDIGNVAKITSGYLAKCLVILTRLAKYIHKVASEKHYEKPL